ncbi:MAG: hypothetical protein JNM07_13925 [Phycisphaerae bacterium]|nr:hypothetical protein [Phycisphaerae bacterium]
MLALNPTVVRFGDQVWEDVTALAIDRAAERAVEHWGDLGPHAVLVDVPEQRVTIRVVRRVTRDEPADVRPGAAADFVAYTAPAGSDAARRKISAAAVAVSCRTELSERSGATRTIELVAVSSDGAQDPVTVSDAPPGAA